MESETSPLPVDNGEPKRQGRQLNSKTAKFGGLTESSGHASSSTPNKLSMKGVGVGGPQSKMYQNLTVALTNKNIFEKQNSQQRLESEYYSQQRLGDIEDQRDVVSEPDSPFRLSKGAPHIRNTIKSEVQSQQGIHGTKKWKDMLSRQSTSNRRHSATYQSVQVKMTLGDQTKLSQKLPQSSESQQSQIKSKDTKENNRLLVVEPQTNEARRISNSTSSDKLASRNRKMSAFSGNSSLYTPVFPFAQLTQQSALQDVGVVEPRLEHMTTFGRIGSSQCAINVIQKQQSHKESNQHVADSAGNQAQLLQHVAQSQISSEQPRNLPKFMETDADGKVKMKRELKLHGDVGAIKQVKPIESSSSSSLRTDSSLADASIDSSKPIKKKSTKRTDERRTAVCQRRPSSENQKSAGLTPQKVETPRLQQITEISPVSETDEEYQKSSVTKQVNQKSEKSLNQVPPQKQEKQTFNFRQFPYGINVGRHRYSLQLGGGQQNPPLEFGKANLQNKVFTQLFKQENTTLLFQKKSEEVSSPIQSDQLQHSCSTGAYQQQQQQPPVVQNQLSQVSQQVKITLPPRVYPHQSKRYINQSQQSQYSGSSQQQMRMQMQGLNKMSKRHLSSTKHHSSNRSHTDGPLSGGEQTSSAAHVTDSPHVRMNQKLSVYEISQDACKIEQMFRKSFFPVLDLPSGGVPEEFKIQPNQVYDAHTIKEATEDLEQSSKGGSIAFKSKGLFFKKANSIASQFEKLGGADISSLHSPAIKQSLSFNQSRPILEQEDLQQSDHEGSKPPSIIHGDISERKQGSSFYKDKRFSNPDPKDRMARQLEYASHHLNTFAEGQDGLKKALLLKQMTQGNLPQDGFEDLILPKKPRDNSMQQISIESPNRLYSDSKTDTPLFRIDSAQKANTSNSHHSPKLRKPTNNTHFYRYSHKTEALNRKFGTRDVIRDVTGVLSHLQLEGNRNQSAATHLRNIIKLTKHLTYLARFEKSGQDDESLKQLILKKTNQRQEQITNLQSELVWSLPPRGDFTNVHIPICLSFETNTNKIVWQEGYPPYFPDDYTPSNCQFVNELRSSSSDFLSSAFNAPSQLEYFNPEKYDVEPVANSSDMMTSLNANSTTHPHNYQNKHYRVRGGQYSPVSNKTLPKKLSKNKLETFTQHFVRNAQEAQRAESKLFQNRIQGSCTDEESSRNPLSNINSTKLNVVGGSNKPSDQDHQLVAKMQINLQEVSKNEADVINLKQISCRQSFETGSSVSQVSDGTGTVVQNKTITPRNKLTQGTGESPQTFMAPVDVHPSLRALMSGQDTAKLRACIPKPATFTQSGADRIMSSVTKNLKGLLLRNMTSVTEDLNKPRRKTDLQSQTLTYLSVPTHRTVTTTSVVSNKERGQTRINQYQMVKKLGQGSFGTVKLCYDVNTNMYYAVKIIEKERLKRKMIALNKNAYSNVQQEMAIMKKLDHPHLVKLYEIIDDPQHHKLWLITEFVSKGTLTQRVRQSRDWLNDAENDTMRRMFRQLIQALEYCHQCVKILHRDIKPDNILIDEKDNIKITDFGVSFMLAPDGTDLTSASAGTALYHSPEACKSQQYSGRLQDLWACACTLYFMCTGQNPFQSTNRMELIKMITTAQPTFPPHLEGTSLQNLILGMLQKNPRQRLTLQQIKAHPWVTKHGELGAIPDIQVVDPSSFNPTNEEVNNVFNKIETQGKFKIQRKQHPGKSFN